jgi:hypothetical protein
MAVTMKNVVFGTKSPVYTSQESYHLSATAPSLLMLLKISVVFLFFVHKRSEFNGP